jgi:hypothetical protein
MSFPAVDPATIIESKNTGHDILKIDIPQDIDKMKAFAQGTRFLNATMSVQSIGGVACAPKKFSIIYEGAGEMESSIRILFGVAPPGQYATEASASKRATMGLSLDDCGDLGRAIDIIDREFNEQVTANASKIWHRSSSMCVASPVKRTYGDDTKKLDETGKSMRGAPRERPIINISIDFTRFPKSFRALAEQPRTTVYDWSTRKIDEKSVETFEELLGDDGNTLSPTNATSVIRSGDIIRRIAIACDGISVTSAWVSMRFRAHRIWIERQSSTDIDLISATKRAPIAKSFAALSLDGAAPAKQKGPARDDDIEPADDDDSAPYS